MKKLTQIAAVAAFGIAALSASVANAATNVTGTFNVNINLTAACSVGTIADVTLAYTSFQTGIASAPTSAAVTCTNTLPYTVSLSTPDPLGDSVVGIIYTTAITGTPPTAGNGSAQTINISVSAAAGQSGTCATTPPGTCSNSAATNKLQTLTVTY